MPSGLQLKLADYWDYFFDEWVPEATRNEPWMLVINGDAIEGDHHRNRTPFSTNPVDQCRCAEMLIAPKAKKSEGLYMVRGTEAHVGKSASEEEALGKSLGAIPNRDGQYVRWDLWKRMGGGKLAHFLHHIGTTGSQAYEATAVGKELTEEFIEAAKWRREAPDCACESHRHRYIKVEMPTGSDSGDTGSSIAIVTPGWQGKTPFAWKIAGARLSTPQFGGVLIRYAHGRLFTDAKIWTIGRSEIE